MTTTEKKKLESSPYNTLGKTRTRVEGNGHGESGKATGTGSRSFKPAVVHVTADLVEECGRYLGVNLEGDEAEHALLAVAHAALFAHLQKPWEARLDSKGRRFLYNCRTGLRAKYHPLEKTFPKLVEDLRGQGFATKHKTRRWLKLTDEGGDYWHNVGTGERTTEAVGESEEISGSLLPEGTLPSFPEPPVAHANVKELVKSVDLLSFKSWWYEDREEASLGNGSSAGGGLKKRYVTLEYDLVNKTFRIILEENVSIDVSDVESKRREPIECWDLHIGATLDILGKNTTLQQGTFETIQWLDYKAARLLAVKKNLLQVLQKYRTASVPAAWSFALNNKPGCCSLRHLMYQIDQLKAELAKFRPSLSETFAVDIENEE